jgi:FkbM family methyltransferase
MKEKVTAFSQNVFDQGHYLKLIEARGATIHRLVHELKPLLHLATALDAGCGVGFFAKILHDADLHVSAFDGRLENVAEARRRFPQIFFQEGDVESPEIRKLGEFDLVLCFGLLYHLENPMAAIRNLRSLTCKALLLESMCLPDQEPFLLLRDEPSAADQSLTDLACYPSEGCLAKMCYRAGFKSVLRVSPLPDHEQFRDTKQFYRRRTILLVLPEPAEIPGLQPLVEPAEAFFPWDKIPAHSRNPVHRIRRFLRRPLAQQISAVSDRLRWHWKKLPVPIRLPFGKFWIARNDHIGQPIRERNFETAESSFVDRFLRPGMTVLDIGAHHGFYSLLASVRVGAAGHVYSFEPSPRERKALLLHVKLNRCKNVSVQEFAIGRENREAELHVVEGNQTGCNSLRPPVVLSRTSSKPVHVKRLDTWLAEANVGRVDFIKLDVEGGELDALKGATQLLQRRPRPVILAEVQDVRTKPWAYDAKEIILYLLRNGFEWFRVTEGGMLRRLDCNASTFDGNFLAWPEERVGELPGVPNEDAVAAKDYSTR